MIQNSNLNKSQVYAYLRKEWEDNKDPENIIDKLATYQEAFLDLMTGSNSQGLSAECSKHVRRFKEFGFPASALPFLMRLTKAKKDGEISETTAIEILSCIESFLIRRAICGIEPTGLHAVFKRLWEDSKDNLTAAGVAAKIREKTTVTWPDAGFVERSIRTRSIYGSSVAAYLIRQYDEALGGDVPSNVPWIEHVLPRNPDASWDTKFDKDQRNKLTNLWANLIPLSSEMNGELSNQSYSLKQPVIQKDAMFKSARKLAEDNADWTPEALDRRSDELVDWALQRWPD